MISGGSVHVSVTSSLGDAEAASFLKFAYSACRIDGNALGWLPKLAYDQRHQEGRIHAVYNNADLVGFCLWYNEGSELRIYQTWVRPDARQILHGRALLEAVESEGRSRDASRITLWCATDLAANVFWRALQFERGSWRFSKGRSSRRHWFWSKKIATIGQSLGQSCYTQAVSIEPPIVPASPLVA